MDTLPKSDEETATSAQETVNEERDRLVWEAAGIEAARAQLQAGLYVDSNDVKAWIMSLDTKQELPPPRPRRR